MTNATDVIAHLLPRKAATIVERQTGLPFGWGLWLRALPERLGRITRERSDSVVALFADEYRLPLIPPEIAAPMAAFAEHLFPILLLVGLATRFSALALLGMTLVIQVFVYPGAYPTHGVWAAVLLYLLAQGPGALSVDRWIATRWIRDTR